MNRVRIALIGALIGAAFSIGVGLANSVVLVTVMLVGVYMGQAVIFPTHNSLLADYYPVPARPRIYSTHRAGYSIGVIAGVLIGAGLATLFSWRAPFLVFAVPIIIVVIIGTRLREPRRREQLAASEQMMGSELVNPRLSPTYRTRPGRAAALAGRGLAHGLEGGRACAAFSSPCPSSPASIAGFASLASLQYQETFHLDALQRAYITAPVEVFDLLGLAVGATIATRLAQRDVGLVFRMLAVASLIAAGFAVLFALAPRRPRRLHRNAGIVAALAVVGPGVLASRSLAIPARVRSVGFSIGALFVLPGLLVLPIMGAVGDAIGFRYGLLDLVPIFTIGGLIVAMREASSSDDVQDVWTSCTPGPRC